MLTASNSTPLNGLRRDVIVSALGHVRNLSTFFRTRVLRREWLQNHAKPPACYDDRPAADGTGRRPRQHHDCANQGHIDLDSAIEGPLLPRQLRSSSSPAWLCPALGLLSTGRNKRDCYAV